MSQHVTSPTSSNMTSAMTSIMTSATTGADTTGGCRSVQGTYPECPLCGAELFAEHAHFKCSGCGWRDSCCD